MKLKKIISRILVLMVVFALGIQASQSCATAGTKSLQLEYFRYVYSNSSKEYVKKNGYALNTVGNEGESHHPVYQIMSVENGKRSGTNFYCLNAKAGDTWNNSHVSTPVEYTQYYDMDTQKSEIEKLNNEVYSNVAKSNYYKQILWILDNMYIPDNSKTDKENLEQKHELLENAGIKSNYELDMVGLNGEKYYGYRYIAAEGYDYSKFVSDQGKQGYMYFDKDEKQVNVVLPDELVEAVQQAAIWYYTNYKDNNSGNSTTYNAYLDPKSETIINWLNWSNESDETNTNKWKTLANYEVEADGKDAEGNQLKAEIGKWYQEQATILYDYLIDASDNYAKNAKSTDVSVPLTISPSTADLKEIDSNNYIVGPIKITEKESSVYNLDKIIVNDNANTTAYISDADGKNLNKNIMDVINKEFYMINMEFYITVPKSEITGSNIKIDFTGTYKANEKLLWIVENGTEQPVVEVSPKDKELKLTVNAPINKEFDLALRKSIIKLVDSKGNEKYVTNEEGKLATRNVTYVAEDINKNKTATYNHRKDPVVVENGDIITYAITVYNEGDMAGYAEQITDKLPEGLTINGNSTGTYTNGDVSYSYAYDSKTNTITFTNVSKKSLNPYDGGNTLSSETIEVECKVEKKPSTSNAYLTNIAYISKSYNSETKAEVVTDRDSSTQKNPSSEQVTTGDKYTGYHGGNNNNGDNTKDVYNDGTNNDDYFPGREDDDDFEVVVIKPAEFDLALQKYISKVATNSTSKDGRTEPKINTQKLADGTKTTAEYALDKTPIKVKQGDYVTYTFTVYNEGQIDGYVNKITDNIPTGLQFVYQKDNDGKTLVATDSQGNMTEIEVDKETYELVSNNSYWSIDGTDNSVKKDTYNGEETISISCNVKSYLGGKNKLLKAYDSSKDNKYDGAGLDRLSVTVVLRVSAENASGITIRNEAAITEAEDPDGNKQDASDNKLKDRDSQVDKWEGKDGDKKYQDDEDYDNIILGKVDLALSKFIAAISKDTVIEDGEYLTANKKIGSKENPYTRATSVDTKELRDNPNCHDATYTKVKTPLYVESQSYVLYDIRVYNEGEVDVYAGEVTDYLPNYLDYISCEFNDNFGWQLGADGKTIKTTYLSYEKGKTNLLKAFDKTTDDGKGSGLDYRDLQVLCRVNQKAPTEKNLVNSAEISKYQDEDGNNIEEDIDSKPDNIKNKNVEENYEDDDDYEVVKVIKKKVDLALSKFIAAISDDTEINDGEYITADGKVGSKTNPYLRATSVDTKELRDNPDCHDATYTKVKDPLVVPAQSYVLYDIRVYNEGETDVYAGEVTDYLPDYLDFISSEFNDNFGWKVESDGKTIKTTYLSFKKGEQNLLNAFDKETDDGAGSGLDYRDLQVLCKVSENAPSNTNIINVAEITKYEDEGGEDIPEDVDSTPDNVKDKNEDDDDYEVVLVKTFDLSLLKWVSTVYVTEDGVTKTTQTGNTGDDNTDIIPKVEINRKKVNSTVVKFGYTIKITNEGDIDGFAKEITDYVPQGLKFYKEDNNGWEEKEDGVITTRLLENTLLQPGESAEVTVIFRWINGSDNLGLKTNIAEISEDYNKEGIPDRDSTPGNKVWGEDDIDDAKVLLSISTGLVQNIIMYVIGGTIILAVLALGIMGIKKFVL